MYKHLPVILAAFLVQPLALAEGIDGFWSHPDQPVWIEIQMDAGTGAIVRNDEQPDARGFELLRNLTPDRKKSGLWHGEVYARKLGEYKAAEVSLPGPDVLRLKVKVGFISRTLEWQRADEGSVMAPQ